jgi:hypothetical protein
VTNKQTKILENKIILIHNYKRSLEWQQHGNAKDKFYFYQNGILCLK